MVRAAVLMVCMCILVPLLGGCSSLPAPADAATAAALHEECVATIADFQTRFPATGPLVVSAHAYAVFPDVDGGAFGLGGAYGRAEVYEHGQMTGYADVTQATIGAQVGGQSYAEIIFFEDEGALAQFKAGLWAPDARATVVAEAGGTGTAADYRNGTAVFVVPQFGLMAQASVGGQRFRYQPKP